MMMIVIFGYYDNDNFDDYIYETDDFDLIFLI